MLQRSSEELFLSAPSFEAIFALPGLPGCFLQQFMPIKKLSRYPREVSMKALREEDSTAKHRNAASYHLGACLQPGVPLLATLRTEMEPLRHDLIAKERQVEDAGDALVVATAAADFAEIAVEDQVREIFEDLGKEDRKNPALGSRKKVFPHGFGPVINKENEDQLASLATLRVDLAPFLSLPVVAADVEALDPLETTFRERLAAKKAAADLVARLEAEEKASRLTTREQLQSAYGRLRDVYKSNPKLAERYFERSRRKPAKKPASTDTGPA